MIRLDLNRKDHWLVLSPGVRVHVRPMDVALWMAAQTDDAVLEALDRGPVQHLVALVKAVGAFAIFEWEGVGNEDGNVIPPSRDAVFSLLSRKDEYPAFENAYIRPWLLLEDEKKGYAPLPNGTSARARDTADDATASVPRAHGENTSP